MNYLLDHKNEKSVYTLFELATAKRPYEELFDIVNDPNCLNNLANQDNFIEDKSRLSKVLDDYLLKTEDPRAVLGHSIWDNFPYYFQNPDGLVPYSKVNE